VQVDSYRNRVESTLWFQRLKLAYHKMLSTFAFNFNLRRYNEDTLNLSAGFHGIDVPVSSKAAYSLLDCDADTGFLSLLTDGTAVTRYTWSPSIFQRNCQPSKLWLCP